MSRNRLLLLMFNGRNRPKNWYVIILNFFHNEIISFCLENGTILQTSGPTTATATPTSNFTAVLIGGAYNLEVQEHNLYFYDKLFNLPNILYCGMRACILKIMEAFTSCMYFS
jgi:hypothetical protein